MILDNTFMNIVIINSFLFMFLDILSDQTIHLMDRMYEFIFDEGKFNRPYCVYYKTYDNNDATDSETDDQDMEETENEEIIQKTKNNPVSLNENEFILCSFCNERMTRDFHRLKEIIYCNDCVESIYKKASKQYQDYIRFCKENEMDDASEVSKYEDDKNQMDSDETSVESSDETSDESSDESDDLDFVKCLASHVPSVNKLMSAITESFEVCKGDLDAIAEGIKERDPEKLFQITTNVAEKLLDNEELKNKYQDMMNRGAEFIQDISKKGEETKNLLNDFLHDEQKRQEIVSNLFNQIKDFSDIDFQYVNTAENLSEVIERLQNPKK